MSLQMTVENRLITKTFPIAVLFHALLIFGTGFVISLSPVININPVLDITLVQTHTDTSPKKVDFIAQADQQASGSHNEKARPSSPITSLNNQGQGESPLHSLESVPDDVANLQPQRLTTQAETFQHISKQPEIQEHDLDKPIHAEVLDPSEEMARLLAEMNEDEIRYAERPRINFIDAVSAKSAVEAAYIDSWVKKIERIGNTNFPDEAIQRNLSGKLILNTTLDHVGNVVDIQIDVSSGYRALDNAALRIVKLASPYPPLPAAIRKKWDQLNITRTWVFHSQGRLDTQ
jgi:protein TonB